MMRGGFGHALQEATALYVTLLCQVHAESGRPAIGGKGSVFCVEPSLPAFPQQLIVQLGDRKHDAGFNDRVDICDTFDIHEGVCV